MAKNHLVTSGFRSRPIPISTLIRHFWDEVLTRLVNVHKIPRLSGQKAVRIYRRRVGNVAMNRGSTETAQDIAAAVRRGDFTSRKKSAALSNVA